MFTTKKSVSAMECLANIITGSRKANVVDVKSEDGLLDTSSTRKKLKKAITWIKKSQKSAVDLI